MGFPTHIVAAAGYVFNEEGRILLIRTPYRGWDCTGGQVEEGESVEQGVLREVMEESGVTARVVSLVGVYSNVGKHLYYDGVTPVPTKVMFDFICAYEGGTLTTSEESLEVKWATRAEALALVTHPVLLYRFRNVFAYDGHVTLASYIKQPDFQLLSERLV